MLPNLRTEAGTELGPQKDSLGERKLESVDNVLLKKKKKRGTYFVTILAWFYWSV